MQFKVLVSDKAEQDIDYAHLWYEFEQVGLGKTFYDTIQEAITFIRQNPFSSKEILKGLRRYVLRKFPYGIYYQIDIEVYEIKIIGIIHFRRSPMIWKKRLKE
jgi:plasmid stabilization system protein ParE